jgi:oligopeptide transport system substrate-binding protein
MRKSRIFLPLFAAAFLCAPAVAADFPQQEFVANISDRAPEWRPHKAYNADEAQILTAIYEGLYVYDPYNLDPVRALAESENVSKDSLEWTFHIRKDAKFANGDPITAGDIRNSWIALLDPAINAPYASLLDPIVGAADYRSGKNADPASVKILAPNAETLIVDLVTPAPQLPKILCHHAFSVLTPGDLKMDKAAAVASSYAPVSSGAFMVTSQTKDEIVLSKNPNYWDAEHVYLPSIRLVLSGDAKVLTERFNRGEIHWLAGSVNADKIVDPTAIRITPMFSTEYFFFRTTWGPWTDAKIRNALLLAIPWADFRANYLIPAKTLVFPIAGYPTLDGITKQNVDEAKRLLVAAGVTDPSKMEPIVISVLDYEAFTKLAKTLETAWTSIGLTVKIRAMPAATYYDTLRTNDYTLGVTSWIGDFADPLAFLELFRPASSLNDSGWNNPGFEQLIVDASACKQTKDRYAKLAEAEKVLLDDGVILPVAHNPSLNVIDTNGITGWYANALDIHPFKFVRFSQRKVMPGVAYARPQATAIQTGL